MGANWNHLVQETLSHTNVLGHFSIFRMRALGWRPGISTFKAWWVIVLSTGNKTTVGLLFYKAVIFQVQWLPPWKVNFSLAHLHTWTWKHSPGHTVLEDSGNKKKGLIVACFALWKRACICSRGQQEAMKGQQDVLRFKVQKESNWPTWDPVQLRDDESSSGTSPPKQQSFCLPPAASASDPTPAPSLFTHTFPQTLEKPCKPEKIAKSRHLIVKIFKNKKKSQQFSGERNLHCH